MRTTSAAIFILLLLHSGCAEFEQCLADGDCGSCGVCDYGSCRQLVCDSPPLDLCANQNDLWVYQQPGSCQPATGKCDYSYDVVNCGNGCDPVALACEGCTNQCSLGTTECTDNKIRSCVTGADGCFTWSSFDDCLCGCADLVSCNNPASCSGCVPGNWVFEKIADNTDDGLAAIVVDVDENVHVTFYDTVSGNLQYGTRIGDNQWSTQELGPGPGGRSLVADSLGNLFAAAIDDDNQLHLFRKPVQDIWQSNIIDSDATSIPALNIYDDQPAILYWSEQNQIVRRAYGNIDQPWSSIDMLGYEAIDPIYPKRGVDFDYLDNGWFAVAASIGTSFNDYVECLQQTSETDIGQTMLSDYYTNDKLYPTIVVDHLDGVHVAYINDNTKATFNLEYHSKTVTGDWQFELVTEDLPESPIGLFYDSQGFVTIAYSSATRPVLKYKQPGVGSFSTTIVDMGTDTTFAGLHIDKDGKIHLLLRTPTELHYAAACLDR